MLNSHTTQHLLTLNMSKNLTQGDMGQLELTPSERANLREAGGKDQGG